MNAIQVLDHLAYAVVTPDARAEHLKPDGEGGRPTLKQMQEAVGGWIEIVPLPHDTNLMMVVNEEGLLEGLPVNIFASAIAGQHIVGNALFVPDEDLD